MNRNLHSIAATLKADVAVLRSAVEGLEDSIRKLSAQYPKDRLQVQVTVPLALWGHYEFGGDWEQFVAFVSRSLDAWTEDKSQFWVWDTPASKAPHPDALRHANRMQIALNAAAKELELKLPVEEVDQAGWHPNEHVTKLEAFISALTDVFPTADEEQDR